MQLAGLASPFVQLAVRLHSAAILPTITSQHAELSTDWRWLLMSDEFRLTVINWLIVGGVIAVAAAVMAFIFWPQTKVSAFPVLPASPVSPSTSSPAPPASGSPAPPADALR